MYEPAFEPLVTRIILPVVVLTLLVVCELGFDFVLLIGPSPGSWA